MYDISKFYRNMQTHHQWLVIFHHTSSIQFSPSWRPTGIAGAFSALVTLALRGTGAWRCQWRKRGGLPTHTADSRNVASKYVFICTILMYCIYIIYTVSFQTLQICRVQTKTLGLAVIMLKTLGLSQKTRVFLQTVRIRYSACFQHFSCFASSYVS